MRKLIKMLKLEEEVPVCPPFVHESLQHGHFKQAITLCQSRRDQTDENTWVELEGGERWGCSARSGNMDGRGGEVPRCKRQEGKIMNSSDSFN